MATDSNNPNPNLTAEEYLQAKSHHMGHELADDIYKGIGGIQQAFRGIFLANIKRTQADYYQGLERDKWIGLQNMGHNPLEVDKQIAESRGIDLDDGEDMDSSVKISGDSTTNITVQSADQIPAILKELATKTEIDPQAQQPEPQPRPQPPPRQPEPKPQPQPQPQPQQRKPLSTFAKLAIASAIAGGTTMPPLTAWLMRPVDKTIIKPVDQRDTIGLTIE